MISTRKRPLLLGAMLLPGFTAAQSLVLPSWPAAAALQGEGLEPWSQATAINTSGQIAGWSGFTFGSDSRAVIWNNEQITDLGTLPGGDLSEAWGVNDRGQVVGWSATADSSSIATLWQEGEIVDLGGLPDAGGYVYSSARAINSTGQIVGTSASHAVVWNDGEIVDLGTLPGGESSEAWDINDAGQIVGQSGTGDGEYHAVLWQDGQITDLGRLPSAKGTNDRSIALAINRAGVIVGGSDTGDTRTYAQAVVWGDGAITALDGVRGHIWSRANAINDTGQIAGAFADMLATPGDLGSTQHAMLLEGRNLIDLGAASSALAINNGGHIVGWSLAPGGIYGYRAVLWRDGKTIDLGTLPSGPAS